MLSHDTSSHSESKQIETNIFTRLQSAPKDALVDQIAMYRTMTLGNSLGSSLDVARNRASKVVNFFSKKVIGKEVLSEHQVRDMVQRVEAERLSLSSEPRPILEELLLREVAAGLGQPVTTDPEALSAALIESAAAGLKIDKDLPLGSQAQVVAERMQERTAAQIQRALKKMNAEQRREYDQQLDKSLQKMSATDQTAMAEALGVNSITGGALRKMLMGASAPAVLMTLVNMSGFGAYIMLTTVIHAVFTTMLGITLPFAVYQNATVAMAFLTGPFGLLLMAGIGGIPLFFGNRQIKRMLHAQTVWLSVRSCRIPIAADDTMLPSYGADSNEEHLKELRLLQSKLDNLNSELSLARGVIAREEKKRTETEERLGASLSKLAAAERQRANLFETSNALQNKLHSLEDEYQRIRKRTDATDEEIQQAEANVELYRKQLTEKEKELRDYDHLLEEQDREISVLRKENNQANGQIEQLRAREAELSRRTQEQEKAYTAGIEKTSRELQKIWSVRFHRFDFSSKSLRFAAKLSLDERMELERCLVDLDSAKDPHTRSRGKMRGQGNIPHLGFSLAPNKPARMQYSSENGIIKIIDIYLRKDQNKTDRQK